MVTQVLRRSDKAFWKMTPAQANHLLAKHIEVNDPDHKPSKSEMETELTPETIGFLSNMHLES